MALPTINDVQAVDPILTGMLVGYMQEDSRFIASRIFPSVPVDKDSGTYYEFTKKYWFLDEMEERAPGQPFARADFGVSTSTYATLQWALDYSVADEVRANSQIPMTLEEAGLRLLAQRALIRRERLFSVDFMKTTVWGTDDDNATTDWDDFSAGDPVSDILTATRTISDNTGQTANTLALGHIVHNALVNHPDILDRLKYVQSIGISSVEAALGDIFGLSNYWVGKASYNTANEAASFSAAAIIDDDALITYVTPNPGLMSATAGMTFSWDGGGGAGQISQYRSDERHSDILQFKMQWDQKATATDVGYFFQDVV